MSKHILDELVDINECSALVRLSVSTLRKMCMRKQIPFYKIGRKVFFHKKELNQWVLNNKAA